MWTETNPMRAISGVFHLDKNLLFKYDLVSLYIRFVCTGSCQHHISLSFFLVFLFFLLFLKLYFVVHTKSSFALQKKVFYLIDIVRNRFSTWAYKCHSISRTRNQIIAWLWLRIKKYDFVNVLSVLCTYKFFGMYLLKERFNHFISRFPQSIIIK